MTDVDQGEPVTGEAVTGTEIVHHSGAADIERAVRMEVIRPLDIGQVVDSMRQHQQLLQAILDPTDWQGRPEAKGAFVKKSGWRKIALAYNLSVKRVGEEVERDSTGKPLRATYTAVAIAPNGRAWESTGHCAWAESRFSGPNGNAAKLEHDMRATAETRAKNRAVSDLIGMGKVSAEEAQGGITDDALPHGEPASPALEAKLLPALEFLLTDESIDDEHRAKLAVDVASRLHADLGYLPYAAVLAIGRTAGALKHAIEPEPEPEDGPGDHDASAVTDATVVPDGDGVATVSDAEPDPEDGPAPEPAHPNDPKIDF